MCPFVVMHDLPFQAADNLTDLLSSMFPDSKITRDYACKHTKIKSIICDLHLKKAVVVPGHVTLNLCNESSERGDSEKLHTVPMNPTIP